MNPSIRSSALLCLCLGLAAPAQAAEDGWYLLGYGGPTGTADLSQDQTDENLVAIFESVGLTVNAISSTLDDSDSGFGFGGGYQVNEHWAVEFGYVNLGSVEYQATTRVEDNIGEFDADLELKSSAAGPVVSVVGILPIGERFSLFGRAGLAFVAADGTAVIRVPGISQRASQTSRKSDPILGVGAEFALSKHFAIRLAWDRYYDVGTENVTGDVDSDFYSLGLRMGVGWFR